MGFKRPEVRIFSLGPKIIRKCIDIRAFADFLFTRCCTIILAGNLTNEMPIATILQLDHSASVIFLRSS